MSYVTQHVTGRHHLEHRNILVTVITAYNVTVKANKYLRVNLVSPCWLRWIIGVVSLSVCVALCFCDNGTTFKC